MIRTDMFFEFLKLPIRFEFFVIIIKSQVQSFKDCGMNLESQRFSMVNCMWHVHRWKDLLNCSYLCLIIKRKMLILNRKMQHIEDYSMNKEIKILKSKICFSEAEKFSGFK